MQSSKRMTPTRLRIGGIAAALAGLCYGAAGYLDTPGASGYAIVIVPVLSVVFPALFLGGLLGLHARILLAAQQSSLAGSAGFVLGCFGVLMSMLARTPYWGMAALWWAPFLGGVTLMGIGACSKRGTRWLGAVVVISGVLGWVSVLSDEDFPAALVDVRPIHVAFAALFCLSSVAWGMMLAMSRGQRTPSHKGG